MNKRKVDRLIPEAQKALVTAGVANNGRIEKTFRGQISTFGAAVMNGSLISAVAFFSDNGGSSVERKKLLEVIRLLIPEAQAYDNLFEYVKKKGKTNEAAVRELIMNAAIAAKLAMNLFELK